MTCAGNKKALNSGSLLARAQHARNDWNSGTVNKHATADRLFHNEKKRTKQQDMAIEKEKRSEENRPKGPQRKISFRRKCSPRRTIGRPPERVPPRGKVVELTNLPEEKKRATGSPRKRKSSWIDRPTRESIQLLFLFRGQSSYFEYDPVWPSNMPSFISSAKIMVGWLFRSLACQFSIICSKNQLLVPLTVNDIK